MYDYVVVGAGSAGCVLAARLTEDGRTTALLLEAGGEDRKLEIRVPAAFNRLFKTTFDWAYATEPQKHLGDRALYWPRGRCLGGSSSINAMIYVRGHRRDYDGWLARGNKAWGFADVLPYFVNAENQQRGQSEHHGVGGPLNVADLRDPNPISRAFVEAAVEAGLPRNDDFNGREQEGVGFYQVTQKRGRRWSAADAYLHPARRRSNLTVETGAHVTRVRVEGARAVGIRYVLGGTEREVRARREVILAAGALGSPQLLLLSGIGPAEHLHSVGIPVVVELPGVGENLQDHLAVAVAYECREPVSLAAADSVVQLARWLVFRRGPLTSNVAEAGGFVRTTPDLPAPDLQLHFAPAWFKEHGFGNPPGHGFTIGPTMLRPESRGRIRLRSRDPLAPPVIEPAYLESDADLRVLVEGVRLARRIAAARPLDRYRGPEVWPGPGVDSDAAIAEYIRGHTHTLYHPVGTCRMGSDRMAVVDDRLSVRGVQGLRVADASIMPTIVGGNTNAPTLMIAEKAADLMRNSAAEARVGASPART